MKILVIENEAAISSMIRRCLERERYSVDVARDGVSGLELALTNDYGLIVLDIMLPKMNGWHVCDRLRSNRNQTPILMVTARDSIEDRVRGLDGGADDYLPKPFDFKELLARVRALTRRERIHRASLIKIDGLEIDTIGRRVTRDGEEVRLSQREFELLEALAGNEGRVLDRETIRDRVWLNEDMNSNMVDVYVATLRKKIDAGHADKLIKTIHGIGYSLQSGSHNRRQPSESGC